MSQQQVASLKSATIRTTIPEDHRLVIDIPDELPPGPAELIVRSVGAEPQAAGTGNDLVASGLFGIWRDRSDIDDSIRFARQLRQRAEGGCLRPSKERI